MMMRHETTVFPKLLRKVSHASIVVIRVEQFLLDTEIYFPGHNIRNYIHHCSSLRHCRYKQCGRNCLFVKRSNKIVFEANEINSRWLNNLKINQSLLKLFLQLSKEKRAKGFGDHVWRYVPCKLYLVKSFLIMKMLVHALPSFPCSWLTYIVHMSVARLFAQ